MCSMSSIWDSAEICSFCAVLILVFVLGGGGGSALATGGDRGFHSGLDLGSFLGHFNLILNQLVHLSTQNTTPNPFLFFQK